ncbi:glycosyltransferase family 4 protein [Nostoc sp.]
MKIAVLVSNQIRETGGGYTFESQVLENLLKLAPESKHTFVLYTFKQKLPENILSSSIAVVSLHRPLKEKLKSIISRTKNSIIHKLRYLRSEFKIEGYYDKFVLNSLLKNEIDLTLSLSRENLTLDFPYITIVWDLQHRLQAYFPEISVGGEWEWREQYYSKMLQRAAFVITGTEIGKGEIEKFYQVSSEKIKVIPLPTPQLTISSNFSNSDILEKYNLPSKYLFYPAQFWSHKNHIGLLLGIKFLKEKYALQFPLVLVGSDQGNESYVREMVKKLDLSNQVYFLGFVPQEDIAPLYRNAFALTFITFFGPDNLPPLEAMALGCPVIASNVSGAKEQLGDAALLVNPKQPEEIAKAIKSLWEDTVMRQTLIERGFKRACKWTTKDYVKEIFSILDDFEGIRRCWK